MNVALRPRSGSLPTDVGALARHVRECVASGARREVVLLRLGRLPPELSRPQHRRLARAALEPLAVGDRARVCELPNGDIVVLWRGHAAAALAAATAEIDHLFADADPALDATSLLVSMSLPEGGEALLAAIAASRIAHEPEVARPDAPLDAVALTRLEQSLARADVARFARRKGIYERLDNGGFALRWEKRFLSVLELASVLSPEHDPQRDTWLFRRLTRSLDRRMLALLAAPAELRGAGPFSLNLNAASILSPEFLRMDGALPAALRNQVVLDMLPADVMADPATFMFARDFAHARGYRILLRGISAELLAMFSADALGVDWLQLRWEPGMATLDVAGHERDVGRMVLARAHGPDAFAWGHANGIRHYQCATDPTGAAVT